MTIGHRTSDIQRGTYRPNAVKTTSPDHLVNTGNSQRHLLGPLSAQACFKRIYRDDDGYEKRRWLAWERHIGRKWWNSGNGFHLKDGNCDIVGPLISALPHTGRPLISHISSLDLWGIAVSISVPIKSHFWRFCLEVMGTVIMAAKCKKCEHLLVMDLWQMRTKNVLICVRAREYSRVCFGLEIRGQPQIPNTRKSENTSKYSILMSLSK